MNAFTCKAEPGSTAWKIWNIALGVVLAALAAYIVAIRPGIHRGERAIQNVSELISTIRDREHAKFIATNDAVIRWANPKMGRLMEGVSRDLYDKPIAQFIHPDERDEFLANFERAVTGEAVGEVTGRRVITLEGKEKRVNIHWQTIRDQGKVPYVIAIYHFEDSSDAPQ